LERKHRLKERTTREKGKMIGATEKPLGRKKTRVSQGGTKITTSASGQRGKKIKKQRERPPKNLSQIKILMVCFIEKYQKQKVGN